MDLEDFLGGEPQLDELAQVIDRRRPAISRWVAWTIAARHRELLRFRGVKGRRAWEQDTDWLLRRLYSAMMTGASGLGCDRRWLSQTLGQRGIDESSQQVAAGVLQEALLRHLGGERATSPIHRVSEAFGRLPDDAIAGWLS